MENETTVSLFVFPNDNIPDISIPQEFRTMFFKIFTDMFSS